MNKKNTKINLSEIVSELTKGIIKSNPMPKSDIDWGNPIATGKEKDQVYLAVKNSDLFRNFKNIKVSQSKSYQDDNKGPIQDNSPNAIDIVIPELWDLEVKIFRRRGGKKEEPNWFNHLYQTDFYTTISNKKEGESAVGDVDKLSKLAKSKTSKRGVIIIVFTNEDVKENGVKTNFEISKYIDLFELIVDFKYKEKIDIEHFKKSKQNTIQDLRFKNANNFEKGQKRLVDKDFHNKVSVYGWEIVNL